MIDLSFLTGEEQETIRAVLKRDAELKKAEEQRVQNLQRTVRDKCRLRYMTGEWFYETKQLRHQDLIHGSEIIRASIRHFHKPLTILEPSQLMPEKPCSVSSETKEVFVPPACGFLQEQLSDERYQNIKPCETTEDTPTTVLHLPTKQRQNPFNSDIIESHSCENKDSQLMDRSVDPTPTQHEEPLPSSDSCISYATNLKQDPTDQPITNQNASTTMAMIEKKKVPSSQDCFVEEERPGGQQSSSAVPRGILKHFYAFSSTDSLSCLDLQSAVSLNSLTNRWIDRKQVSFSSTVSHSGVEWQDRKELGENRLLDVDSLTPSEVENKCELEDTGRATVCTHRPLLTPSQVDLQEGGVNCKTEANIQEVGQEASQQLVEVSKHCISEFPSPSVSKLILVEQSGKTVQLERDHDSETHSTDYLTGCNILHQKLPEERTNVAVENLSNIKPSNCGLTGTSSTVSPKSKPRLLGIFRGEKENTTDVQSQKEDEVKIGMQKEPGNTQNLCQGVASRTTDKPGSFIQDAKPSETTEVGTLQVTSFQNTPFKVTVTSVDPHQEATESRAIQLSERLSNLKALWEREKSSPKIVFTTEEERQKDDSKSGVEAPHGYQTNFDLASMKTNMSPQKEIKVDTADKSPQSDSSFFVDLFKEDGTYRANPVIIYEETRDSLTGSVRNSKISEPQDNVIIPIPSCLALNTQNLERDIQIPLPSQSSSSPQGDKPAKISKAKHFLEKEYNGPMVIAVDSRISILNIKDVSQQSDLRTSLDIREESDEEAKAIVSYGSTGDVKSACHQYQVKADTEYQERPLSLRQSHTSKPKNDEIRRSPSKTCHPRVLPRESFSPKKCKLEGSSLRAFSIDINPQSKFVEEQQGKPTTVPRQEKSLLTETKPGVGITSQPLPPHPEDRGAYLGNVNTYQCSSSSSNTPPSKKKMLTLQSLVRSFIPQDKQPFLGPKVESDVPLLHQDRANIALQSPQSADFVGKYSDSPIEGNLHGISSWIVQNNDGNASQNTTAKAWSLSRISSGSYDDGSSPILSAFKRFSSRCTSSSKSLENLFLQTTSTLSSSKQMKTGMSMTVLQQEENDSDSTFETNLGWRRNTGSSTSNFSLSSGMASVSGSICSLYPEDVGDIEVHGSIHFALNYIQKLKEFHIFVVHCRDLAVADNKKNCSDPYVKCYLLPDKTKLGKRKTTVKKNTLNPTYNELLKFKIVLEVFKTQSLNISVWHSNTFGRNSFLGEVDLDMSEWDFNNTHINEYALKNKVSGQSTRASPAHLMDSRGQMRVALRYLPQMSHSKRTSRMETGEVQIWVKDCKNLPPVRGIVTDPFVKCTILPDTSKKSRQKTRVVKRAANPMFNHTMVYDGVRLEHLKEACVEMTVWDHDRLNNHYIGGLRLGLGTGKSYGVEVVWMDSTTDEANLWQRMLHSDGEWVEDDLPLRMLVMVKK
ncbi:synaptotagmin-like protein 2 [Pungitius pungitius]|uniref:synaptotagmin-like protein 2 n=1 Tax=Pungitius pungitius TaxID=134920 RepID=UPI002E0D5562